MITDIKLEKEEYEIIAKWFEAYTHSKGSYENVGFNDLEIFDSVLINKTMSSMPRTEMYMARISNLDLVHILKWVDDSVESGHYVMCNEDYTLYDKIDKHAVSGNPIAYLID